MVEKLVNSLVLHVYKYYKHLSGRLQSMLQVPIHPPVFPVSSTILKYLHQFDPVHPINIPDFVYVILLELQ